MTLHKDKLPNDNVFIWFGTYDEDLINNALILASGDVLILMGIQKIELKPQIKEDISNLSIQEFIDKYNLIDFESMDKALKEINKEKYKNKVFELIKELKEGVKSEIYPPFMANNEKKVKQFKDMINVYLDKISKLLKTEDVINHIEDVINKCEEKIQLVKKERKKRR